MKTNKPPSKAIPNGGTENEPSQYNRGNDSTRKPHIQNTKVIELKRH